MAEMLSYVNSRSTQYIWNTIRRLEYADENYAREIMQLFSVGLHMLNNDGTLMLDEHGKPILTYTTDDITQYARLWTGFQLQPPRGNIEDPITRGSRIDPMMINVETRDRFPKVSHQDEWAALAVRIFSHRALHLVSRYRWG